MSQVSIEVDGVARQVDSDQNLLEAIRGLGIEVPSFCYHPDLPVAGNCRICLVEIEGPRGWQLAISCQTQPRAGLKVRTHHASPAVAKARRAVMEFELVNHPLDCPICDKAGECLLHDHYQSSGRHLSRLRDEMGKVYKGGDEHRFTDAKGQERGGKAIPLGPRIVLDQERCILCSRCVRLLRDVCGSEQLGFAGRGEHAVLTTFPGSPLDHPYDLCTTDVCPVGALTGTHFRFRQRVWFLQRTASIAPDDSLGANLWIEHNGGVAWRLMPRRNPEVNRSWLHNGTRLLADRLHDHRLTTGLIDGAAVAIARAVDQARVALAGARRVALVASGHQTVEDNALLLALAAALGGKARVFGGSWLQVGRPDGIARSGDPVANRRGLELLGVPADLDALVDEAAGFDCLFSLGHDLWAHDPGKAAWLERIPQRLVATAWRDASAERATIALPIRAWAETDGVMINCQGRAQMLNPAPILPDVHIPPAWRLCADLAGRAGATLADAWAEVRVRAAALARVERTAIGPEGLVVAPAAEGAP